MCALRFFELELELEVTFEFDSTKKNLRFEKVELRNEFELTTTKSNQVVIKHLLSFNKFLGLYNLGTAFLFRYFIS